MPREDGQFKKGCKGGPGRPRGIKQIPDLLRRIGKLDAPNQYAQEIEEMFGIESISVDEVIWYGVSIEAMKRKPWAIELYANRKEGRAPDLILENEEEVDNSIKVFISGEKIYEKIKDQAEKAKELKEEEK